MTTTTPRRGRRVPVLRLPRRARSQAAPVSADAPETPVSQAPPVDIAPQDPVLAYFQSNPEPVEVDSLKLESPGVTALREAGVKLVVPLVSQGELIGLLNLGPRLSEQDYSADDRKLLENLAGQAAPALRVAQLVREQEAEVRLRERFEQEMRVAQLIQQNFLPTELPDHPGWSLDAFYRPAREVGGDFYDVFDLPDGRLVNLAGVTDGTANAVNESGTIVGESARHPVRWASAQGTPEELPLPAGASLGEAHDIDEDGTIVGFVESGARGELPYVWFPDGTHRELTVPARDGDAAGRGVKLVRAYTIRNGWATGIMGAAPDPGVMTVSRVSVRRCSIAFVNGFAANDPESTAANCNLAMRLAPQARRYSVRPTSK